jgi:hypothetical protein
MPNVNAPSEAVDSAEHAERSRVCDRVTAG